MVVVVVSNINNDPLSPPISTTTHSHLQYQQQPPLTSNINNNPLSPPISTTTHSDLQYQQQPTLPSGESVWLWMLEVGVGCC
jgi:hypothetical protein